MDDIQPYNADANGNPTKNLYTFPSSDSTLVSRLRRVEKGVRFRRGGSVVHTESPTQGVSVSAVASDGSINVSATAVQKVGSLSPSGVTGQFAATATTTSITWFWDGTNSSQLMVIHRSDGTVFPVPAGSITVTGLSPATAYYFLPFWSTTGGCAPGWVTGTLGSPKIAFVLADTADAANTQSYISQQTLQNREQLTSGFMSYSTPAAGSSSGTGGGGGGAGKCVMNGTAIEPIGDYGDVREEILPQREWFRIMTRNSKCLYATPNHPVYTCYPDDREKLERVIKEHGYSEEHLEPWKMVIDDATDDYLVLTDEGLSEIVYHQPILRYCTKRAVHMDRGHLFWANGILSHNSKPAPIG